MTTVSWVTALLDLPPDVHEAGTRFWSAVTAYAVSPPRGDHAEFTTLLPPVGDPFLKIQRTGAPGPGRPGLHLDLHVASVVDSAARAEGLGAAVAAPVRGRFRRAALPRRLRLLLRARGPRPTSRGRRAGRSSTRASSTRCVSTSRPAAYDTECAFWSELTGWPVRGSVSRPEFRHLVRPDGIPIRLLLQRLGEAAHGAGHRPPRPRLRRPAHRGGPARAPRRDGRGPPLGLDHPARPGRRALLRHRPGPALRPRPLSSGDATRVTSWARGGAPAAGGAAPGG